MNANKKTLMLLGTAIATTVLGVGACLYVFIATKEKTEATAILSDKVEELSGKESRVASSLATLRKEASNIEKIYASFFKENENVSFIQRIEALGPQSNTTFTIESLENGYAEKTIPFLSFRIRAVGKFSDVNRLILLIENFPGKLDWKTIRLVRETPFGEVAPVTASTTTKGMKVSAPAPVWRLEASLVALNFSN